jgi:hypothetical protein
MRPFLWFGTLVALILMNLSIAGARSSTASQTVVPNGICNSSQPCIKMTNKSTGEALDGQSYSGNGIGGATYSAGRATTSHAMSPFRGTGLSSQPTIATSGPASPPLPRANSTARTLADASSGTILPLRVS